MKKILIIGGTQFIGRNLVEKLLADKKYDITLFNRGITNPTLFPQVKRIKGDRKKIKDLAAICSQDWDVVIDISGYWAKAFEDQWTMQTGKIGRYIYISTSSHYQFNIENPHLIQETEEIVPCTLAQKSSEDRTHYNQNKAECERILEKQKEVDYLILRPGLVIGKYDHTDRLYYWFYKAQQQKEILVANEGKNVIAYTNVLDLADLIIQSIEAKPTFRVYNCSSFIASIADFLKILQEKLNKNLSLISATPIFLEQYQVKQWTGLPLWIDSDFLITDNSRIQADYNFEFSTLEKTVEELLHYYAFIKKWEIPKTDPAPISSKQEKDLLNKIKDSL